VEGFISGVKGLKSYRFAQIIMECHELPHTTSDSHFKSNGHFRLILFILKKSMTEICRNT
jgi:hypothetical protein